MGLKKHFNLGDWLAIHELDRDELLKYLNDFSYPPDKINDINVPNLRVISGSEAWDMAAEALSEQFPDFKADLEKVRTSCTLDFSAPSQDAPYTLAGEGVGFSKVLMCYNGTPADMICVAHEFGHAAQNFFAQGNFIPPMQREIAAFISELSFLKFLAKSYPELEAPLKGAWNDDSEIYLREDLDQLVADCAATNSHYSYRWNYPLARLGALALFKTGSQKDLSRAFLAEMSLEECLTRVSRSVQPSDIQNYLPEIPEPDAEKPAINAYRSLGMMLLLDIDYWQGESEKDIDVYYQQLLGHMQEQTALVTIGPARKPIGYATWNLCGGDDDSVEITRQAAPFGNHLELLRNLKSRLPKGVAIKSLHERSSRREQVAW